MIGGKKDKDQFSAGGTTLLAGAVEIEGEIRFGGELEIEGKVIGNIHAETSSHDAKVNVKGVVEGEIRAPRVIINGQVSGDVYCTKHLELASKAVVNGNVHYAVIEMVKGAQVNGSLVHITEEEQKKARVEPIAAVSKNANPTSSNNNSNNHEAKL